MPTYDQQRDRAQVQVEGAEGDDAIIGAAFIVPARSTLDVFSLKAVVSVAGAGSSEIELVDSADLASPLASVLIDAVGVAKDETADRFPLTLRNSTENDKSYVFQTVGDPGAGTNATVFASFSDPQG
jgi:hypothetical protein